MRILYVVSSTNLSGGATKSFLTLIDGLAAKGIEPHIVTPGTDGLYEVLRARGYAVLPLRYRLGVYPNHSSLKDLILFLPRLIARRLLEHQAARHITDYCRQNDIQLIHSNVSVLSCGSTAARKLHIPHIFHVREYADIDFGYHHFPTRRTFYDRLNAENTYTICITKGIQQYHKLLPPRSRVIYNGIAMNNDSHNPTTSLPHNLPASQPPYLLFAGRIEPSKGVLQVVEAFNAYCQQHPDTDATLKIAGGITNVAYYNQIQTYMAENQLQERILFLGDRTDLDRLMQGALATIVASTSEGFGRCLPEAMLNGCLTIGRNTAGTREQYDNGLSLCGTEIGLRYDTTQQLTWRMQEVVEAPAGAYEEMKACAYNTVRQLYSTQTYVENVLAFYQDICKKEK